MKLLIFLTTLVLVMLSACTYKTEGERVSFKDKEVKLTILHTTDVHSKIVPFQFTPNSWDRKVGLMPQNPQAHAKCIDTQNTTYYDVGLRCLKKNNADDCRFDLDCSDKPNKLHCYNKKAVCVKCTEDSHCGEKQKCLNHECVSKTKAAKSCYSVNKDGGISHGVCYDDNGSVYYGGFARIGFLLEIERSKARRSIYLDSGDLFQGHPIFNFFQGEAELRAMNKLKPDAKTIGNHEFDEGVKNWVKQVSDWTTYPIVGANYVFDNTTNPGTNSLNTVISPYTILERDGLRIGVIGLANTSTIISITNAGNSMGITPEESVVAAQYYIDLLKDKVDLIVVDSHEGLDTDQYLCKHLKNADVIVGGHHHVLTDPPQEIKNLQGGKCVMLHSGKDGKFLTAMHLTLKDVKQGDGFAGLEVVGVDLDVKMVDNSVDKAIEKATLQVELADNGLSSVPEDKIAVYRKALKKYSEIKDMLDNYEEAMYQMLDISLVIGEAVDDIPRTGTNGSTSPLGNLVADAMLKREFIDADFSITNTLGIRADLPKGDIIVSKIFEIFPFNNSIMTMTLSGSEVQEMLDYAAYHSAERGCMTQVQVAGISVTFNCAKGVAEDIIIGGNPLNPYGFYEVSTNDYMGRGGSGFAMLARVTSKTDTKIELRNAVINYIRQVQPLKIKNFEESRIKMKR